MVKRTIRVFKSSEQNINHSATAKTLPVLLLTEPLTPNTLLQQRSGFNEQHGQEHCHCRTPADPALWQPAPRWDGSPKAAQRGRAMRPPTPVPSALLPLGKSPSWIGREMEDALLLAQWCWQRLHLPHKNNLEASMDADFAPQDTLLTLRKIYKLPLGRSHSARIWGQRSSSLWVTWNLQHLRFCSKMCLPQFERRWPVCPTFAVMMLDLRAAQCPWAALWAAGWASRGCQFGVTQILTVKRYFALGYCPQNIICQKKKNQKRKQKNKQNENVRDTFTWYFSGSWKWEIMNKNVHYKIIHFSPWFTSQ